MTEPETDPIAELAETAARALTEVDLDVDLPYGALRPVVEAVLAEAAAQQWIEKQLAETGIRSMDFRNGMHMELESAREMLAHQVAAARAMLGDATNYTETKLEWDVKVAESPEMYTIVIQRHAPGALTPHEARQKAEAERDRLLKCIAKVRGELDQYAAGKWTGGAVERFQELRRDVEAWLPEADPTPAASATDGGQR